MPTKIEPGHAGYHLCSESDGTLSREAITVASGSGVLVAGTVLGKVTASGKYVPYDNAAGDGSQVAAAVLFAGVDATSADAKAVGHLRLCEIWRARLAWKSTQSAGDKTAAYADLAATYVVMRD